MTTQDRSSWWLNTVLLAIIGAVSQFALLWLLATLNTDRIGTMSTPIGIGVLVVAIFLTIAFQRIFKTRSCLLAITWAGAYFIINMVGMVAFRSGGMPIWAFLPLWIAYGLLGAWIIAASPAQAAVAGGTMAALGAGSFVASRQRNTALKSSGYGRIPPSTVILLSQHVRTAHLASNKLPPQVGMPFRNAAVAVVLDHIVRDWWENQNLEGLSAADENDLGTFVQLAWSVCRGGQSPEEALAVFKAVLTALLDDWCESWNANGAVGAPAWQY